MSDEELNDSDFGIRGIEKSQGYSPMPLADAPPQEDLAVDAAVENFVATRDDPAPIVEREFLDVQTGHKRPETETVSAEDAARNVANVREAERRAVEEKQNRDLQDALDQLEEHPGSADPAITAQPRLYEQPQQPEYQPQPDAVQMDPQIDPEVAAALQNPKVRSLLEGVNQTIEATKSQYQEQVAHAGMTAVASFVSAFPELANLNADQLPGAIALINQTNPARAQEIATHYNRVNGLVQQMQQVSAQTAQQRNEMASAQFKQFAVVSDHRFDSLNAHVPAETMKAIKTEAVTMLKEYGLSDADLAREYNSNPLFRSAAGQQIIADAARYRLAQRSIPRALSRPIPNVQRPGSPEAFQTRTEAALAEARSKLKPAMSAREAANYLIARRGAHR